MKNRKEEIAEILKKRLEELQKRDGFGDRGQVVHNDLGYFNLRQRYISLYRGKDLDEIVDGDIAKHGDLVIISTEHKITRSEPQDLPKILERIRRSLWLIYGIRGYTQDRFRKQGVSNIEGLIGHPRFGKDARYILKLLEKRDWKGLIALIEQRAGRGNLLSLSLSTLLDQKDLIFLDIETTGLFLGGPICLVGLAWNEGDRTKTCQLVALDPGAEKAIIETVQDRIKQCKGLITFNGRGFDFPYLCSRSGYWSQPLNVDPIHIDLLPFARTVFRGKTSDCRLSTLAKEILGIRRDDDIPSDYVPSFYKEYLEDKKGRIGLLRAVILHNRNDVYETVSLYFYLKRLCEGIFNEEVG